MYKVTIIFNILNGLDLNILDDIPIKQHRSNGSVVINKNNDPFIDYYHVTLDEVNELVQFVHNLQTKDIELRIKLHN
jgi:hypothetical protein